MKVTMECDVQSRVILGRDCEVRQGDKTFLLSVDKRGVWNRLRLTAPVKDPSSVQWGIEPVAPESPRHAPFRVHANIGRELYEELTLDIQRLECTLAFSFPVQRVNWASPKLNIVYEAAEGPPDGWHPLLDVASGLKRPEPTKVDLQPFLAMAMLSPDYHSIVVPLSFWREGENELDGGRFINAFYDFYFIIEGLYGKGKTRNQHIMAEFRKSKQLRAAIDSYMRDQHPVEHLEQLNTIFAEMKKNPDHDGVIHALVKLRGELHHFNARSGKAQSRLDHRRYTGISMLARYLARKALLHRMLEIGEESGGSTWAASTRPGLD